MQILSLSLFLGAAAISLIGSIEAFAPVRIVTPWSTTNRKSYSVIQASDKPLTELCEITKEACDAVSPMLNGEFTGTMYFAWRSFQWLDLCAPVCCYGEFSVWFCHHQEPG